MDWVSEGDIHESWTRGAPEDGLCWGRGVRLSECLKGTGPAEGAQRPGLLGLREEEGLGAWT